MNLNSAVVPDKPVSDGVGPVCVAAPGNYCIARIILTIVLGMVLACAVFPAGAEEFEGRFPTPAEPRPTPPLLPPAPPPAEIPPITVVPPSMAVPPGAEKVRFVLRAIVVKGATVYSGEALQALYADLIGTEISVARLFELAEQIQRKYRDDGYFLARVIVPPQTASNGVFELQVIEGYISGVRIEGDVGWVKPRIQAYLDRITHIRPVREQDVDRYLLLINDIAGVQAFGVLRRSQEGLGGSELVLRAERKPVDVAVVANNRGSKYTGPNRAGLTLQENAATALGERIGVFLFATEDHEQRFGQVSYEQLLGSDGLKLLASASVGPSEPGYRLSGSDMDTKTESRTANLALNYPLIRSRDRNLYLQGGFEAIRSTIDIFHLRVSENQLRVLYLDNVYEFRDRLFGDRLEGQSMLGLGLRKGLEWLGASKEDDPYLSPQNGSPGFTKLLLKGSRYQPLLGQFGLSVAGNGQYAFTTLLQDETFCLGGEVYGRGYAPCELAGDSGLGLSVEARYTDSRLLQSIKGNYQLYGFYDIGAVWHKEGDDYPEKRQSLASTGLGVRTSVFDHFFAGLEMAWPFSRSPQDYNSKSARFFFQLSAYY